MARDRIVSGKTVRPKITATRTVFQEKWFKIVEHDLLFPGNKKARFQIPTFDDIVAMVPISRKGHAYMVNEWRPSYKKVIMQIPAGKCPYKTEAGRLRQARNELREEIGMDSRNIRKLGSMMMAASLKTKIHVYLATGLFKSEKAPDEHEHLQVVEVSIDDALKRFLNGEDTPQYSIAALILAKKAMGWK
ncbi:MAG: NUDIX hydrolase [Candidatus Aenigmarchaeota archaeon]|nr:NUDIX hydrolase [Candidatus Aenigmarchaeota archaeon]